MAKLDANLYRVYLETAVADTYAAIGGQRSSSKTSSRSTFSKATKGGDVDVQGVGLRSLQLTCEGMPDLPDANGFTRAKTLYAAGTTIGVQVRKSPFADSDDVFECDMIISNIDESYPFNDGVGYQITFVPAAEPTNDTLA